MCIRDRCCTGQRCIAGNSAGHDQAPADDERKNAGLAAADAEYHGAHAAGIRAGPENN